MVTKGRGRTFSFLVRKTALFLVFAIVAAFVVLAYSQKIYAITSYGVDSEAEWLAGLTFTSVETNGSGALRLTYNSGYAVTGTYQSSIFGGEQFLNIDLFNASQTVPAGTSVVYKMRGGWTPTPDGEWDPFRTITPGSPVHYALSGRWYYQLQVTLTSDPAHLFTPLIDSMSFDYYVGPPDAIAPSGTPGPTPTPAPASFSQNGNIATWRMNRASDFSLSDSAKLKIANESAKIVPNGAVSNGYQAFYDSEWGSAATVWAIGITVDDDGNIYVAGNANPNYAANSYNFYAFIEKLDSNYNVLWNKKYFYSPGYNTGGTTSKGGFNDIAISPHDGYLYGLALRTNANGGQPTLATASAMKINPANGDVVWQKDTAKTLRSGYYPWVNTWDEGTGPKFDSEGNFYINYSDGCSSNPQYSTNYFGAGPLKIIKYDPNGNELWTATEDFVENRVFCAGLGSYEDVFEMVVDSENSVYITSSYFGASGGMNVALVKYDKNGSRKWRDAHDYSENLPGASGGNDSPRSLSIDSDDNVYVNSNAPNNGTYACLLRKVSKDGNVLIDYQNLDPTGNYPDFKYCWGADIDQFDRWVAIGENLRYYTTAYYKKTSETSVELETLINNNLNLSGFSLANASHKTIFDKYGNVYGIVPQVTNSGGYKQFVILKSKNTYPNTMPTSGTPVTLINNTGLAYETLTAFSISYGEADQNDAGFQISNNGTNWYFWNGSAWVQTTGNDYNDASTINSNISSFATQVGSGTFYFKTFMLTDGAKQVDLASVSVTKGTLPTATPTAAPTATETTATASSSEEQEAVRRFVYRYRTSDYAFVLGVNSMSRDDPTKREDTNLTTDGVYEIFDQMPIFRGITYPDSDITIEIINSSGQKIIGKTTSDADGYWQYRPEEKLAPGEYTVVITVENKARGIYFTSDIYKIKISENIKAIALEKEKAEEEQEAKGSKLIWIYLIILAVILSAGVTLFVLKGRGQKRH